MEVDVNTKQVQSFILWMRKERISCTTLHIGNVVIDGMVDGKLVTEPAKVEPAKSLWQQYGAALLEKPVTRVDDVPDEAKED